MTHYILTRFLYSQDEVILSLVTSLLKRDDLQESYYWAYELYYSGVDMTSLFGKYTSTSTPNAILNWKAT